MDIPLRTTSDGHPTKTYTEPSMNIEKNEVGHTQNKVSTFFAGIAKDGTH